MIKLKEEMDSLVTTYRRLRKPDLLEVEGLYKKIMLITFVTGLIGVLVVLLSALFDVIIRTVIK